PTAAVFRPQSSSNLLIVGQQDEAALGTLMLALLSLAAQHPPGEPVPGRCRFYVLDGSAAGAPYAGLPGPPPEVPPHPVRLGGWREVPAVLAELAAEMERRQKATGGSTPPAVYLVVFGLQRFRDLRKQEDDFGFGRRDEEQQRVDQQFATLLREGSNLGLHTL